MTRLQRYLNGKTGVEHKDDVAILRASISAYWDGPLSDQQIEELWREYSEQCWAAGWISPYDETLVQFRFWLLEEV
jgi:hypothetical protein